MQTKNKQKDPQKSSQKMVRRSKETFLQKRQIYGQKAHKKCLQSLIISEMQIKIQWGITSHLSECPLLKPLQTMNAIEDVEKREPSYSVGGNVNWCSNYGEQYGVSLKK